MNCTAKKITPEGMLISNENNQEEFLPCDTVVCAAGVRTNYREVEELTGLVDETYILGDSKKPRKVTQAISEAYYAAKYL